MQNAVDADPDQLYQDPQMRGPPPGGRGGFGRGGFGGPPEGFMGGPPRY